MPENSYLGLDVRKTRYLDNDIIEILDDFSYKAKLRNITIQLISERGVVENPDSYIKFSSLGQKLLRDFNRKEFLNALRRGFLWTCLLIGLSLP